MRTSLRMNFVERAANAFDRFAVLLAMMSYAAPVAAANCPGGGVVDDAKYCHFYFYRQDVVPVDPRISVRINANTTDETHSIALVIGIGKYPNLPGANLSPATNDVKKLKDFFRDNQQFDEVIVLEDGDVTSDNIEYFLANYLVRRASDFGGKS